MGQTRTRAFAAVPWSTVSQCGSLQLAKYIARISTESEMQTLHRHTQQFIHVCYTWLCCPRQFKLQVQVPIDRNSLGSPLGSKVIAARPARLRRCRSGHAGPRTALAAPTNGRPSATLSASGPPGSASSPAAARSRCQLVQIQGMAFGAKRAQMKGFGAGMGLARIRKADDG